GRTALLPLRERLLHLADLRLLEQPDGDSEAFQGGAEDGRGGDEGSVAVTGQDLRGGLGDGEAEPSADELLDLRRDGGVRAHRASHLADGDLTGGRGEPFAAASHLVVVVG